MKKNNKKKALIALVALAFVGVIGVTYAYFKSSTSFENLFKTEKYEATFKKTFTSPENWTPGTTTPNKVEVTNSGKVAIVARAKIEQSWESANKGPLDLQQNGNTAAVLNFPGDSKWQLDQEGYQTGYYYYTETIGAGATSSPFLESVTFNKEITNDVTCSGEGTVTCTSTGNGYDGATYKLTITIETVQADAKDAVWKTA